MISDTADFSALGEVVVEVAEVVVAEGEEVTVTFPVVKGRSSPMIVNSPWGVGADLTGAITARTART